MRRFPRLGCPTEDMDILMGQVTFPITAPGFRRLLTRHAGDLIHPDLPLQATKYLTHVNGGFQVIGNHLRELPIRRRKTAPSHFGRQ